MKIKERDTHQWKQKLSFENTNTTDKTLANVNWKNVKKR